jgi:monoamine oxidase
MAKLWVFLLVSSLVGCVSHLPKVSSEKQELDCEIAVVGGGPAGVFLGYKLSPRFHENFCLFEKAPQLGGRMVDESREAAHPIWVGTGARRVNTTQKSVLKLGKELGISFQKPAPLGQLIHTSKRTALSSDGLLPDFPTLIGPLDTDPQTSREEEIYALLLKEKARAQEFSDLKTFIQSIAGEAALRFLRDSSRFHGDFDYGISTANYLEMLEEINKQGTTSVYPVGGMHSFTQKMEERIRSQNGRIFLSEPLLELHENPSQHGTYLLLTPQYKVTARRVVLAIPPSGIEHLHGPIAKNVREAPQFRALFPVPVVVINQWWKKAWWKNLAPLRNQMGKPEKIWRGWSSDQCINHFEIPQEAYAAEAKVTRSVYADDPLCVRYWLSLMETEGVERVEREIKSGLEKILSPIFEPPAAPLEPPIKTSFHYWPGGWYYVRPGTGFSNNEIAQWSIEPLPNKKNLMLAGESYWPNLPGWSEGAYRSAELLLKDRF